MITPRPILLKNLNLLANPVGQPFDQKEHVRGKDNYKDVKEGYCSGASTHWIERTLRASPSTQGLRPAPPGTRLRELKRFSPVPPAEDETITPASVQEMVIIHRTIKEHSDNTPNSFQNVAQKVAGANIPVNLTELELVDSYPTNGKDATFDFEKLDRDLEKIRGDQSGACAKVRYATKPIGHAVAVHQTAGGTRYLFDPNLGTWNCGTEGLEIVFKYLFGPMEDLSESPGLCVRIPEITFGDGKLKFDAWRPDARWREHQFEFHPFSPDTYVLFPRPKADVLGIIIPIHDKPIRSFTAAEVIANTNLTGSGSSLKPIPLYWEQQHKEWLEFEEEGTPFSYSLFKKKSAARATFVGTA
jgi:hypothetical protein